MLLMMALKVQRWCRMLGSASYTFARLLVKAVRTIQDPAASVAALVESDS